MNAKHDFDGIKRVMRAGRLVSGCGIPLLRSMHLSPDGGTGGGGEDAIATLDASDLIEVDPEIKASAIKGKKELGQFVARVQSYALSASKTLGEQREKLVKMAADLKAAKETTDEALKAAQRAEAIAKDNARMVPGGKDLSLEALKTVPLHYEPDQEFVGKMTRGHYNVLMLSRAELGLLDEPVKREIERFRALHDTLAMVDLYMLSGDRRRAQNYLDAGGMKGLRLWKSYEPLAKRFAGALDAMDTAESGAGSQWVPTGVGISIIEDIRPDLELVSYIPSIPMPRSPYIWPVQGNHFKTYKIGEGTQGDLTDGVISKRNLSTLNLTFTAVKQAAMTIVSSELAEDSIVALIAAIRADLAFAVIAGTEDAVLNGQLTAVIDSADAPGATDVRSCWDGLRYFATLTGASYDFSAGLLVEGLTNLKGQMGKYGKNSSFGVWAMSYIAWAKALTLKDSTNALVLTADRVGTTSALQSGTLGLLLGSPIAVCDDYPQAMGAAGLNDGSAVDRTGLLYFDRRGFRLGEVRLSTIEASRDWAFSTDQLAFRVTYRSSFKPVRTPAAGYKVVGAGVGIPIA